MDAVIILGSLLGPSLGLLVAISIVMAFLKNRKLGYALTSAVLVFIAAVSGVLYTQQYATVVGSLININQLTLLFSALFAILLFLINTLVYSNSENYIDFSVLLGFVASGIFVIILSTSILETFIGIEITVLLTSFIIMISQKRGGIEPAIKLFIMGAMAAATIALGIALVLPYSPNLTLTTIASANIATPYAIGLPLILLLAGLSFEAGAFPFNLWIPDVYDGAPTYVTAMLAGVNKKVALVAIIDIFFIMFAAELALFSKTIAVIAIFTMFFGNILALKQERVKRLLAYAAIAQTGYILIGFAVASAAGLQAAVFYMVIDAFTGIGAFAIVLWLEKNNVKNITDCNSLYSRNEFGAIALTIFLLSMAGIPLLAGFAGKFLLFSTAISSGMLLLALVGILNVFISIYYFGRLINNIFIPGKKEKLQINKGTLAVIIVCLIVVIAFGVYPQPLIGIAKTGIATIFP